MQMKLIVCFLLVRLHSQRSIQMSEKFLFALDQWTALNPSGVRF